MAMIRVEHRKGGGCTILKLAHLENPPLKKDNKMVVCIVRTKNEHRAKLAWASDV